MLSVLFFLLRWFLLVMVFMVLGTLVLRFTLVRQDTDEPMILDHRSHSPPIEEVQPGETGMEAADRMVGLPLKRFVYAMLSQPVTRTAAILVVLALGAWAYYLTWF